MTIYFLIIISFLGAAMGSFAAASVWRLRARYLRYEKEHHQDYDHKEFHKLKDLSKVKIKDDRSHCLNCGHDLAFRDLIPIYSWFSLGGRCRYCHHKIGKFEIIMEVATAVAFGISYYFWPYSLINNIDYLKFIYWLVALVLFIIIAAYDSKWFEIPATLLYAIIAMGGLWAWQYLSNLNYDSYFVTSLLVSAFILSGIYLTIWLLSRGRWIGFGDIELGLAMALFLVDWRLAFIALFSANLIGTVMVLPGLITKRLNRRQHIPFGPLLIIGFFIAFFFGDKLFSMILM